MAITIKKNPDYVSGQGFFITGTGPGMKVTDSDPLAMPFAAVQKAENEYAIARSNLKSAIDAFIDDPANDYGFSMGPYLALAQAHLELASSISNYQGLGGSYSSPSYPAFSAPELAVVSAYSSERNAANEADPTEQNAMYAYAVVYVCNLVGGSC